MLYDVVATAVVHLHGVYDGAGRMPPPGLPQTDTTATAGFALRSHAVASGVVSGAGAYDRSSCIAFVNVMPSMLTRKSMAFPAAPSSVQTK